MLIDENNDPVYDTEPLKKYMDKWDGQVFIDTMKLDKTKTVLEIGVGTGRLALKTIPLCKEFVGIDLSPKTINKAKENLFNHKNISFICDDFMNYRFENTFDVVYSSLTFMHIKNKRGAIKKIDSLLNNGGKFCLSIDKNQSDYIDMGTRKVKIYPDSLDYLTSIIKTTKMKLNKVIEIENAYIIVCCK